MLLEYYHLLSLQIEGVNIEMFTERNMDLKMENVLYI